MKLEQEQLKNNFQQQCSVMFVSVSVRPVVLLTGFFFLSKPGTAFPWLLEKQIKVLGNARETGVESLDCIQVHLHQNAGIITQPEASPDTHRKLYC